MLQYASDMARILSVFDEGKIVDYFKQYNDSIAHAPGVGVRCRIDTSDGLDSIVCSIFSAVEKGQYYPGSNLYDGYTFRYRYDFCMQALNHFLTNGEVLGYNVSEVIDDSIEKLPFPVGKSFERFAEKARSEWISNSLNRSFSLIII